MLDGVVAEKFGLGLPFTHSFFYFPMTSVTEKGQG